ncbi:uncharacterized protein CEXT_461881 [Caerostris extrusa]|uniref:Uncharacterized protein n=1 Tax=Caerostris extrusa TaxID=172846 RepID=A0AAV4VQ54_CAEEX|nr:uncharacterized protein CEXT_461881 [Caerostris extrusa]
MELIIGNCILKPRTKTQTFSSIAFNDNCQDKRNSVYTVSLLGFFELFLSCMRIEKDTDGETEGGKKIRRRLPPVPLDQEPVRRTKDRTRTLSMGAMPLSSSASDRTWERRRPQRTTSLDDGMSLTTATTTSSDLDFLGLTTSTDTYLQFLSSTLFGPTTTTSTTSVLASIPSSIGMSTTSLLGRRDLSAPHSLSSYMRGSSYILEPEGPKLPSYITSLKQQLRDELRSVTEQRRRITDPDLSGLLSHTPWTTDPYERKLGTSTLPPVGEAVCRVQACAALGTGDTFPTPGFPSRPRLLHSEGIHT